ncbi:hypothetical protein BJV78DRAFT_1260364 [Lactifluus subvellereus]|nr:hypothetical protein BJV78DRAFT_1260364 [Lactifluus subvellereus]
MWRALPVRHRSRVLQRRSCGACDAARKVLVLVGNASRRAPSAWGTDADGLEDDSTMVAEVVETGGLGAQRGGRCAPERAPGLRKEADGGVGRCALSSWSLGLTVNLNRMRSHQVGTLLAAQVVHTPVVVIFHCPVGVAGEISTRVREQSVLGRKPSGAL